MAAKILIIDRNEAFATMLVQMLTTDGGYEVQAVHSGRDALAALEVLDFDLTILDMDLEAEDMDYRDLIHSARRIRPTMRFMLIPLMGGEVPAEARRLDIQGTLTKPFFADDLLPGIKEALTRQIRPTASARPTPRPQPSAPATPRPAAQASEPQPDVQAVLAELAHETAADEVVLLSLAADEPQVVARVGQSSAERLTTFVSLVHTAIDAAQKVAAFLEQPGALFEHTLFEGSRQRLYALVLAERLLVIVTPVSTPLGTIRHNLRRARRKLSDSALT